MNEQAHEICEYLRRLAIPFDFVEHAAVQTIGDCEPIDARLNALTVKNYFLTTRNKKRMFLCLVPPEARFDSSSISAQAGASRLSFGSPELLNEYLRVYPGAVSPMGLYFDTQNRVTLLMEDSLFRKERLAFHPCDNTCTVAMRTEDFLNVFLPSVNHSPLMVTVNVEK